MGSHSNRPTQSDGADFTTATAVPAESGPGWQLDEVGSELAPAEQCLLVLPWARELDASKLLPLHRPAPATARMVLGALPKLNALRSAIQQYCPIRPAACSLPYSSSSTVSRLTSLLNRLCCPPLVVS